uniref:Uncharacterized protein n=1 Tax=Setaria italica TaxID=4555 RepID=K3XP03_SETIT
MEDPLEENPFQVITCSAGGRHHAIVDRSKAPEVATAHRHREVCIIQHLGTLAPPTLLRRRWLSHVLRIHGG